MDVTYIKWNPVFIFGELAGDPASINQMFASICQLEIGAASILIHRQFAVRREILGRELWTNDVSPNTSSDVHLNFPALQYSSCISNYYLYLYCLCSPALPWQIHSIFFSKHGYAYLDNNIVRNIFRWDIAQADCPQYLQSHSTKRHFPYNKPRPFINKPLSRFVFVQKFKGQKTKESWVATTLERSWKNRSMKRHVHIDYAA